MRLFFGYFVYLVISEEAGYFGLKEAHSVVLGDTIETSKKRPSLNPLVNKEGRNCLLKINVAGIRGGHSFSDEGFVLLSDQKDEKSPENM